MDDKKQPQVPIYVLHNLTGLATVKKPPQSVSLDEILTTKKTV